VTAHWNKTIEIDEPKSLIAVTFERFGDEMLFPPYGKAKCAFIRGQSLTQEASFRFQTGYLPAPRQEMIRRLGAHGFTVVRLPQNWRHGYHSELNWQEAVIIEAIDRVNAILSPEVDSGRIAGYDAELAEAILQSLNASFPNPISLIELKYQFSDEPTDAILSTALRALIGDGFIEGTVAVDGTAKINPLERISLTKEGRRHLEEMKRKVTRSTPKDYTVNDASQFILACLLDEFREKKLTTDDLRDTYEGIPPSTLKTRALSEGISEVDFDLAMSDLDAHELVKTGPMKLYDNPPYSSVTVIAFISENKFSYLTEGGYREATRHPSKKNKATAHIHISDSTFHNSPIGVGDRFAQTIVSPITSASDTLSAFRVEVLKLIDDGAKQREIIARLDELEAATDKPTILQRYNNLVASIGSHITVFGPLLYALMEKLMR